MKPSPLSASIAAIRKQLEQLKSKTARAIERRDKADKLVSERCKAELDAIDMQVKPLQSALDKLREGEAKP